jgi:hypothetical protein
LDALVFLPPNRTLVAGEDFRTLFSWLQDRTHGDCKNQTSNPEALAHGEKQ